MCEAAAPHGFFPLQPKDVAAAREVVGRLMGHDVVSEALIHAIIELQPAAILVRREAGEITGVVATLLLTAESEPTLRAGAFNGLAPEDAFLARPLAAAPIYYLWGIAGSNKTASSAVMEVSKRFRYDVLADLTCYALAATPVGRHVGVTYLGFQPVRRPDDDLLVSPATERRAAA